MLTKDDRAQFRIHYVNRFRTQSFEKRLPVDQTETKEYQRLDRVIKNLEADLQDARAERVELNRAFDFISAEERAREAKKALGVTGQIDALLTEVYERTQQATYLQGSSASYRSRLAASFRDLSSYVKHGSFYSVTRGRANHNTYDTRYVIKVLLDDALTIMCNDRAKKGVPLYERVKAAQRIAFNVWIDAGRPIRVDDKAVKAEYQAKRAKLREERTKANKRHEERTEINNALHEQIKGER